MIMRLIMLLVFSWVCSNGGNCVMSGSASTGGTSGCTMVTSSNLNSTIANTSNTYSIVITLASEDISLRFRKVEIYYSLQVSPAPSTATFTDVPASHMFFQYVEALAASGITTGCTSTQYCPNNPVTRGQMAVFLSKLAGLHWPL